MRESRRIDVGTEGASLPANLSGTCTASTGRSGKQSRARSDGISPTVKRDRRVANLSGTDDRGGVPRDRYRRTPHDRPLSSDRSPLDDVHVAAGASFTDFAGWQMPVRYSSDLAEHHAVRTAAGLFDLSHMAEILDLGPEAAVALDYALAGRISAVEDGQAKYSLLLARDGGIIDDLVVYRTGVDRFLVVANAGNRELVVAGAARPLRPLRLPRRRREPTTSP